MGRTSVAIATGAARSLDSHTRQCNFVTCIAGPYSALHLWSYPIESRARRKTKTGARPRNPIALIGSAHEWLSLALTSLLQAKGYTVLHSHTGAATRDQARTERPDLILLNTPLFDMDDLDLCRALRHDPLIAPGTPIITLTQDPTTARRRLAALEAGASEILSPPLLFEEVCRTLDACVGASRLATDAAR